VISIADPLTRRQLDSAGCQVPGCDHRAHPGGLALHPRCHINAGTWVWYDAGVLTIRCKKCEALVCKIAVAENPK
jgi:hypothetical protein